MLSNKTTEVLVDEVTEIGYEIEMIDYNRSFGAAYDESKKIQGLRRKAYRRLAVLDSRHSDLEKMDVQKTSDFMYAGQFI